MRDPADGTIVFVEVRYRGRPELGGGLESVDGRKRSTLRRTALAWLQHHADPFDTPARIDVVAVEPARPPAPGTDPVARHADEGHGAAVHHERVVACRGGHRIEWVANAVEDDG